jgi:NADP-dependent aldehyde dehydrogenase
MFKDATIAEVREVMSRSAAAFRLYSKFSLAERSRLMRKIADELEALGDELIAVTMRETHLPEVRLKGERGRTIFQLKSYADACERGDWLEATITTPIPDKVPPRPDIRKMLVPLGPVVVFGSSNFPYAYSTAGGDTASALAAGCTVVVKAHPAHPETSSMVAAAISKALDSLHMPQDIFIHLHGADFSIGEALVKDSNTQAVGFTGSFSGGMALFNWANQRKQPIPVFAEMGSVNPVFLFPEKLASNPAGIAQQYAESITLGVGQFCTNPGVLIGIASPELDQFEILLAEKLQSIRVGKMLHAGISSNYVSKASSMLSEEGVNSQVEFTPTEWPDAPLPVIASTDGKRFLENPKLHEEVFGPFSLLVKCSNAFELSAVAESLEGQLTSTMMATINDIKAHQSVVDIIQTKCGRLIMNGVPTGVEVCQAMHHGGPFPASTDARFTSVGADAIKRFARPLAYQNFPDELLPEPLQNANPLRVTRTVDDMLTIN